jgi:hypothetical protein
MTMPWYISLYVALLLLSLPAGVMMLRRLEQDWLHPVGGALSTVLSALFVISFWLPELVRLQGVSTLLMYGFVLLWDGYLLVRLRARLPELYQLMDEPDMEFESMPMVIGLILMLPAYVFGALVCLRAMG